MLCVCVRVLACELIVEVDDQRVVPPVKGREQMKETQEAHLRGAEEEGEIHSHDLLNEQREVKQMENGKQKHKTPQIRPPRCTEVY